MSSSLCWEPIAPKNHNKFGDQLKFFLREWLGGDGVVRDARISEVDIDYLRGAAQTANVHLKPELEELIEAVKKHKEIRVWEQF